MVGEETAKDDLAEADDDVGYRGGREGIPRPLADRGSRPDDPRAADDPNARAMIRLVDGLEVDIELDAEATITHAQNWVEMKAKAAAIADTAVKAQQAAGADAKALAAVR